MNFVQNLEIKWTFTFQPKLNVPKKQNTKNAGKIFFCKETIHMNHMDESDEDKARILNDFI